MPGRDENEGILILSLVFVSASAAHHSGKLPRFKRKPMEIDGAQNVSSKWGAQFLSLRSGLAFLAGRWRLLEFPNLISAYDKKAWRFVWRAFGESVRRRGVFKGR